jgi:ribosomal protein S4
MSKQDLAHKRAQEKLFAKKSRRQEYRQQLREFQNLPVAEIETFEDPPPHEEETREF